MARRPARWLTAGVAASLLVGALAQASSADEQDYPSQADVSRAREAAGTAARDVATVQAELVLANQRLRDSAVAAAQATEAYNGARWHLAQARQAARAAARRAEVASADLTRQSAAYADTLASTYELAPQLHALSAIVHADGIETVLDHTYTLDNAESALNSRYDVYRASSTLAEVAVTQAADAQAEAEAAQQEARSAR
ncbi:MAG TPA: hypothetical protein PLP61_11025, partial [Nocardioides sp.]|uniref:hypothetical protein n=1 Tax=Nocardioides sp. TaxID=35761 RepID=UPI002C467144